MNNITFICLLLLCLSASFFASGCGRKPVKITENEIISRAKEIHESIITLDTHVDIAPDYATPEMNPGTRLDKCKVDLVKMKEGGLDGVFFIAYVGQKPLAAASYMEAYEQAMIKITAIRRMCYELNPDMVELAVSPDDIMRISKKGKLIAMIGIENGFSVGEDVARVKEFYDLGARYITITHQGYNQLGDSSDPKNDIPASKYGGLSKFGKQVIGEMNRLGMIVDVSHIGIDTFNDIIELTEAPVIASHSGCRALCDVTRNLNDEQLKGLKKNGGVIQTVALGAYLAKDPGKATIQEFVDHIDYSVNLIGIDHVGIGTDFDGGGGIPGFNDASECLNVTIELVRRGYSKKDIEKIWGGNLLRVWREVEKVAAKMQK